MEKPAESATTSHGIGGMWGQLFSATTKFLGISSGNNNKATFGFVVKRTSTGTTKGQLDFKNYATGDKVHSEQITSLSITLNSATFTGTGRNASGNRCYFRVTVQDISKDGKADTFKIEGDALNPLPPCASAGPATLSNGNIVINNS